MTLKPGIHFDVSAGVYFADPCEQPSLTQSLCKTLLDRSPRHAWLKSPKLNLSYELGADGYDADRIIGDAAHALMLGRGKKIERLMITNFRTADARKIRDAAFDAGRIPILPHHYERVVEMVEAGREQLRERNLEWLLSPDHGSTEVVIAWQEDGVWFRSLVDFITEDCRDIGDYKTGGMSAAPHAIDRKMMSDGVHIQAAFQERGLDILRPHSAGRRSHWFIFQENEEPFALTAFPLSEEWMVAGRKQIARAERMWRTCMRTKVWPRYPVDTECPPFPNFAMTRLLEAEIVEDEKRREAISEDHLMAG